MTASSLVAYGPEDVDDTVCECGHWWDDHDLGGNRPGCKTALCYCSPPEEEESEEQKAIDACIDKIVDERDRARAIAVDLEQQLAHAREALIAARDMLGGSRLIDDALAVTA